MEYLRRFRTQTGLQEEIFLSFGPEVLGNPQDGSWEKLFSHHWRIQWQQDGKVLLLKEEASGWTTSQEVDLDFSGCRHLTLAFDQVGRQVIGWQKGEEIFLAIWDNDLSEYQIQGPIEGVDPCLCCDASIMYQIPDSDVLLFHLSTDRLTLGYRLQSDLYGTFYPVHTFDDPEDLLSVTAMQYRLILHTSAGDIEGNLYPFMVSDPSSGTVDSIPVGTVDEETIIRGFADFTQTNFASAMDGLLEITLYTSDVTEAALGGISAVGGGGVDEETIIRSFTDLAQASFGNLSGGGVSETTIFRSGSDRGAGSFSAVFTGSIVVSVTPINLPKDPVQGSIGVIAGGSRT